MTHCFCAGLYVGIMSCEKSMEEAMVVVGCGNSHSVRWDTYTMIVGIISGWADGVSHFGILRT